MEALFSVGQKVVCVNSIPLKKGYNGPNLVEGKVYTVKSIRECDCGNVTIDVGLVNKYERLRCSKCLSVKYNYEIGDKYWVNQFRFVPLDDNDAIEDEIRESLNLHLKV